MAETGSTEKTTKEKFDAFMGVLARDEDLKPLDPRDLISHLLIEGVISDADYERIETVNSKEGRKVVRLLSNYIFLAWFELPGSPPNRLESPWAQQERSKTFRGTMSNI